MAMLNNQMVNLFPFPLILEDVFIWFHVELRVCALVSCLVAGVTRPCIVKPFIATWQQVLLIGVVSSPMVYCLVYSPYREGATNVVGVSSSFKTGASWHEPWGPQEPRLSLVSNREKLVLNFVVLNLHPLGRYIYIYYIYIYHGDCVSQRIGPRRTKSMMGMVLFSNQEWMIPIPLFQFK